MVYCDQGKGWLSCVLQLCARLIFEMKTSCIHETCNSELIQNNNFSPQIGIELATQAPSSIILLMRKPKSFINKQNKQAKHDDPH